jgi:hypothetical protein
MDPDDECCFDMAQVYGWPYVCNLRYRRFLTCPWMVLSLRLKFPFNDETLAIIVAQFLVTV